MIYLFIFFYIVTGLMLLKQNAKRTNYVGVCKAPKYYSVIFVIFWFPLLIIAYLMNMETIKDEQSNN